MQKLSDLDEQGLRLVFRAGDISARHLLMNWAEEEYGLKHWRASAMCFHAEMYLADRLAYELHPPPTKFAIPTPAENGESK